MSYKRVDLLIEMMPAIIKEIPDAVLHIVGSGIVENNLKQLTEQLGVENNVVFTGFMNDADKVGFLQRAWVFVIASMKEGWGLVAIEANACGTPVIGFNVPGLCEAIDNPHSGILVECNDDFIKNTIRILKDSKFRESLSQGGIIHANKFNWDKTAAESLNILVDICNEKKASVTAKL
jgi:glycosyltransferase involved in cell wall biosynthesis